MSESEPITFSPHAAGNYRGQQSASPQALEAQRCATFTRQELTAILAVYGRKVAAGEWRDYAIDIGREKAVFSVFRRASELPLFRIEKSPEAGAQAGRLQRRGAGRADPQARARPRPRPHRPRRPPPPRQRLGTPRVIPAYRSVSDGYPATQRKSGRRHHHFGRLRRHSGPARARALTLSRDDRYVRHKSEGPRSDPRPLPIQCCAGSA